MYYDKINFLMPTRGRADLLLEKHVASSVNLAGSFDRICYTFLIDSDDEDTAGIMRRYEKELPYQIHVITQQPQPTPHLANFYNKLFSETKFKDPGTLVGMVGDDMEWRTPGFDLKILSAANKRDPSIICCDDGFHHSRKRFVNMVLPRWVVEATGKPFMCPLFPADYTDDMWWKISEGIGATVWLDEVVCYHDHASRRPQADRDLTCQRLRAVVGDSRRNLSAIDPWVNECVANIKASGLLCTK